MSSSSWLRNWKHSLERRWALYQAIRRKSVARRLAARPRLEALEDRTLLSANTYLVNLTGDAGTSTGALSGDIRYCITQAEQSANAGSTVTFDTKAIGSNTISLSKGELAISDNMTIQRPGASSLTISGGNSSRIFDITSKTAVVTISGLTLSDGNSAGEGGGIFNAGTLTVSDCNLSGNTATHTSSLGVGGGVFNEGTLTVSNCTLSGNSAYQGGAIDNFGSLTLSGTTLTNNTALAGGVGNADGGAILNNGNSSATLSNCTLSDNHADFAGGGINNWGSMTISDSIVSENTSSAYSAGISEDGNLTVSDSTVAGNTASADGGGFYIGHTATVILTNDTIADNSAGAGGGMWIDSPGNVLLHNTLIAGNSGGDVSSALNSASDYNLIDDGSGGLSTANHNLLGVNPLLAPLGNYGGPMQTMALLPGSPAIDAGSSTYGGSTDQRGMGRVGTTDIGAFESQGFSIAVSNGNNQSANINSAFANPLAVAVTANNSVEPVTGGAITFTVPASGVSAALTGNPATIGSDGKASVTATANSAPGAYAVTASATGIASSASFSLYNGTPIVVTTLSDENNPNDGTTSLREAIAYAETQSVPQGIAFDPSILTKASGNVIDLQSALPDLTGNITIEGPGANILTVQRDAKDAAFSVFKVDSGATAAISGLTISGGSATDGGGINNAGSLTVSDCTLYANASVATGRTGYGGGGIYNSGSLTVSDCTLSGNYASIYGGGIDNTGSLRVSDSTLSGNTASINGGGLYNGGLYTGGTPSIQYGTATVSDSTLSGNTASEYIGGGIDNEGGTMTISGCTLSGNRAYLGGGISITTGTITVSDSTLSANSASGGGGIINGVLGYQGDVLLHNTLIAGDQGGDVSGDGNLDPTSDYNLIGDGSGGLSTANHNLLGVNPLLAPLGNYGGPTQTMALLPGSPAIDAGSSAYGGSTDQRGMGRVGATDIGAFESQGFSIAVGGGNNQNTAVSTAFANSLVVSVKAIDTVEPVAGGTITFTAPASGASAVLKGSPATIASDGKASVTATANSAPGAYVVTASAPGVATPANFSLNNIPAVFTVTSAADDGSAGTLRDAITQVNAAKYNEIDFNIKGTGPQTINLTSALPALTASGVFINGQSENQFQGVTSTSPLIELNGSGAGSSSDGLMLSASNCIVSGLILSHFNNGIEVAGSNNTIGGTVTGAGNIVSGNSNDGLLIDSGISGAQVQGNFIGTDATGANALANGIGIEVAGSNNTIGGTSSAARNVLSGNSTDGVLIDSTASGVTVQGNYIGTDATGGTGVANGTGVVVSGSKNTLGGTAAGAGNVISGNTGDGVLLSVSGVTVQGNYIGTDATGNAALANRVGIEVAGSDNTIGGTTSGARNVLSGNSNDGVLIDSGVSGVRVQGNYIGTDTAAAKGIGNSVGISASNANNTVGGTAAGAGNVISGNTSEGVQISASGVTVQGNYIGTDVTGTQAVANSIGILVSASQNTIGGTVAGANNVISGNRGDGVQIASGVSGVLLLGNSIGTDLMGSKAVANSVGVEFAGSNNTIGGPSGSARNLISGNSHDGVLIDSDVSAVLVQGNFVGTNAAGTAAVGNGIGIEVAGSSNTLGGSVLGARNVISGNSGDGVLIDSGATGETVQGNYIGLDYHGKTALVNGSNGIDVQGNNNLIGGNSGSNYYVRNFISGNTGDGLLIDSGATGNQVLGNFIGLDISGTNSVGNSIGVEIAGNSNTVGATSVLGTNFISGNKNDGILLDSTASANLIQGTDVGTDYAGRAAVANGSNGVEVMGNGNTLGDTTTAARNILSGNSGDGVKIDSGVSGTLIQGNFIGLNAIDATTSNAGNGINVAGTNNTIGGTATGARNLISGNTNDGVLLGSSASGNVVLGNFLGVNLFSNAAANSNGIEVAGTQNTIGGSASGAFNVISGNKNDGVLLDRTASGNVVLGNSVGLNVYGTVAVGNSNGIEVAGTSNTVGASYAVAPNIISGNSKDGVLLDSTATGNQVLGNYIGTNHAGTAAMANQVGIEDAGNHNTLGGSVLGARNVISGNSKDGVLLDSTAAGETVQGNYIGLNYNGKTALGNGSNGVEVQGSNNLIGGNSGSNYFTRNFLSGNTGDGLLIANGATGNQVLGNFIGIDVSGTHGAGNSIAIEIAGNSNTIGGTSFGLGNVISGNSSDGLRLDSLATNNVVQRNDVGTNYNGTSAVSNGGNGVTIVGNNNTLGGSVAAAGNIIAYNSGHGVLVSVGVGNTITSNSIFANTGVGIALSNGGNNNIVAATLSSATLSGSTLTVQGSFTAPTANVSYVLQFFANPTGDPEGKVYLGSLTLMATTTGSQSFTFTTTTSVTGTYPLITATLTDNTGDTSAFSSGMTTM